VRSIAIVLLLAAPARAEIVHVATTGELTTAIGNAQPGDEIVLANGTYAITNLDCATDGTAATPIVVRAESPLGALVEISGLEGFRVTGAHWRFDGLDVRGVCPSDPNCEHAFHVSGAAHGFVLRRSRVRDFNAQLKVNAAMVAGSWVTPNNGLVEYNDVGDTHVRATSAPVTKLNIDTGDDWIVRGNVLHDAYKGQGDGISYVAFMKSGGKRGLFERNLVLCSRDTIGGTRIGLSFGGGGTGPAFCAPNFDPNGTCDVEHDGGTMRNNIIVNCNDVGIYLNRSKDTHLLFNTLISTSGVDFRFATTSGEAVGNLLSSAIRTRDGATMMATQNVMDVPAVDFTAWYKAPLEGDLEVIGDITPLIASAPYRADVVDDYCGATRPPGAPYTMGALEHTAPICDTTKPPMTMPDGPGGDGGDGPGEDPGSASAGGCCQAPGRADWLPIVAVALLLRRKRFRRVVK
jgi:parallel beta-helix repeat protein